VMKPAWIGQFFEADYGYGTLYPFGVMLHYTLTSFLRLLEFGLKPLKLRLQ
jgi:hypothetical protein